MIGATLSRYRVLEQLGAGGMGVVYKAEDLRLGRLVALKFISEAYSRDATAVERFEREARAASSFNHPGICTLYDIDWHEGRPFLVMELLEGQTLRQKLDSGPLQIEEWLEVAIQIADALSAAHAQGVLHRDIKPGNIFLTTRGQAKVMDFGLAKLARDRTASSATTLTLAAATAPGVVPGTIAYMSPEQLRGEQLDARSDIFSFGVVLYEAATGRHPGTHVPNLRVQPPRSIRADLPQELERIILKALSGSREDRQQSMSELGAALRAWSGTRLRMRRLRRRAMWAMPVAALGLFLTYYGRKHEPFSRIEIVRATASGKAGPAAISPDGRYLAFVVRDAGRQSIWIRQLATGGEMQIKPADRVVYDQVGFSPDGNSLYVSQLHSTLSPLSNERLRTSVFQLPVWGGTSRRLADVAGAFAVSPDGRRLAHFGPCAEGQCLLVSDFDGGNARKLASRKKPDFFTANPAWSPDGKTLAYAAVHFTPSGTEATLATTSAISGGERRASRHSWFSIMQIAWMPGGRGLILSGSDREPLLQIWRVSQPDGGVTRVTHDPNQYVGATVAADGRTVATVQSVWVSNLWVTSGVRPESPVQVTSGPGRADGVDGMGWTPDGSIVYSSWAAGKYQIWIVRADGTGARPLTEGLDEYSPRVSPDGRFFVFGSERSGGGHIWKMDLDGGNLKQVTSGVGEDYPDVSPGGEWIVYYSYLGEIWKVSANGDHRVRINDKAVAPFYGLGGPAVSPDGRMVAFRYEDSGATPSSGIAVAPVEGGPPVKVFPISAPWVRWTPDGGALAYIRTEGDAANIWLQPLSGDPPRQFTKFTADFIFTFDWSRNGAQLAIARGYRSQDAVIIRDLR